MYFRGIHCPVCRRQLSELNKRLGELSDVDVGKTVAVSMESAERSNEVVARWRLPNLPVAYGLSEDDARDWGLFILTAINDGEPAHFSEPGIFILDSDGTVYANEHNYSAQGAT